MKLVAQFKECKNAPARTILGVVGVEHVLQILIPLITRQNRLYLFYL